MCGLHAHSSPLRIQDLKKKIKVRTLLYAQNSLSFTDRFCTWIYGTISKRSKWMELVA